MAYVLYKNNRPYIVESDSFDSGIKENITITEGKMRFDNLDEAKSNILARQIIFDSKYVVSNNPSNKDDKVISILQRPVELYKENSSTIPTDIVTGHDLFNHDYTPLTLDYLTEPLVGKLSSPQRNGRIEVNYGTQTISLERGDIINFHPNIYIGSKWFVLRYKYLGPSKLESSLGSFEFIGAEGIEYSELVSKRAGQTVIISDKYKWLIDTHQDLMPLSTDKTEVEIKDIFSRIDNRIHSRLTSDNVEDVIIRGVVNIIDNKFTK